LEGEQVEIYIHKVRDKWVGKPGQVTLRYDRITGRYSEPEPAYTPRRFRED
jgi:hypothetical protein